MKIICLCDCSIGIFSWKKDNIYEIINKGNDRYITDEKFKDIVNYNFVLRNYAEFSDEKHVLSNFKTLDIIRNEKIEEILND